MASKWRILSPKRALDYDTEVYEPFSLATLANSSAPVQGSKSPKSGKEGFGVKKPPFPPTPEKGVSSQKVFIFHVVPLRENGGFLARNALFWVGGKRGGFLTPRPSFPDFEDLTPVQGGGRIRNAILGRSRELVEKCVGNFGATCGLLLKSLQI